MRTPDCGGIARRFNNRFAMRETLSGFRLILFAVLLSSAAIELNAKTPLKAQIARLQAIARFSRAGRDGARADLPRSLELSARQD